MYYDHYQHPLEIIRVHRPHLSDNLPPCSTQAWKWCGQQQGFTTLFNGLIDWSRDPVKVSYTYTGQSSWCFAMFFFVVNYPVGGEAFVQKGAPAIKHFLKCRNFSNCWEIIKIHWFSHEANFTYHSELYSSNSSSCIMSSLRGMSYSCIMESVGSSVFWSLTHN